MNKKESMINISPNPIIFRDLEPGEYDEIDFVITNYSLKMVKLRFSLPFNSPFKLNSTIDFNLSSGLQVIRKILYTAADHIEKTEITVSSPDFDSFKIPVIFYPPSSLIEVSESKFDFGEIPVGFLCTGSFKMVNYGTRDGNYKVVCDNSDVELRSKEGVLTSNETEIIQFVFKPNKSGPIDFLLNIYVDSTIQNHIEIPVHAIVKDHSMKIYYNGKECDRLEFGRSYFGQKTKRLIKIVNNAPVKRAFVFQMEKNKDKKGNPLFIAVPNEGEIDANSSLDVTIHFEPPLQKLESDFEMFYKHVAKLDVLKTPIVIPLELNASCVQLNFTLSCLDFEFGNLTVDSSKTQQLKIENTSQFKDIKYDIAQIAHFHFNPRFGVIKPGKNATIDVSFDPKSLGEHEASTWLELNNGIIKRQIVLKGVSKSGTNEEPGPRKQFWENNNVKHLLDFPNTQYGLTREDIAKKETQKRIFDEVMAEKRLQRKEKEMKDKMWSQAIRDAEIELTKSGFDINPDALKEQAQKCLKKYINGEIDQISLGFDCACNLEPPPPPADKILSARAPRRKPKLATNKITTTKSSCFKTKPTTNAEIVECSKTLSPSQQMSVSVDSEFVDFGVLPITVTSSRTIMFENRLSQHVLVALKIDDFTELSQTRPTSQVIPPNARATFELLFKSSEVRALSREIKYLVNNTHEGTIRCIAKTTPIELRLSSPSVNFDMSSIAIPQPMLRDRISVINPTSAVAEVKWNANNDRFGIFPLTGVLQPNTESTFEITFRPGTDPLSEACFTLRVKGGPDLPLRLRGSTGTFRVSLSEPTLDFDLVPLGLESHQDVLLRNHGPDPAIFFVNTTQEGLSISPSAGKLMVNEAAALRVSLICSKPTQIDTRVEITVPGQSPISLRVLARAEAPRVELDFESLDFGRVFLGSFESRKITLRNIGSIAAVVTLDLSSYGQFGIEFDPSEDQFQIKEDDGPIYTITVASGGSSCFNLVFRPTIVNEFAFELPLQMADSTFVTSSARPVVSAQSIMAPLSVSDPHLDFGPIPLFDAQNPNVRPGVRRVTIRNRSSEQVSFSLETGISVFTAEPDTAVLEPQQEINVSVTFKPVSSIPVVSQAKLVANFGRLSGVLVSKLTLCGTGLENPFKPDTDTIILPPVPLCVRSERRIEIINVRCIETKLNAVLAVDEKSFPLSVTFPEGNELSGSVRSLPILFSFSSDRPISFSTPVAITDTFGHCQQVIVCCTSDNSIFTLYPVLSNLSLNNGQTPRATQKMVNCNDFLSDFAASIGDKEKCIQLSEHKTDKQMVHFVQTFVNCFVLATKSAHLAEDLAETSGDLVFELISGLTGKKQSQSNTNGSNQDKITKLKSLLGHLSSFGAHVSRIRPEFLLNKADFTQFYRTKVLNRLIGESERNSEAEIAVSRYAATRIFASELSSNVDSVTNLFEAVSEESWTYIVMQILRVFLIPKLRPDSINKIAGFAECLSTIKNSSHNQILSTVNKPNKILATSNVFSAAECAILKWVRAAASAHFIVTGRNPPVINTFEDLQDPAILSSCISRYCDNIVDVDDADCSVEALCRQLRALRLHFVPDPEMITNGSQPVIALISFQLLQTLPHYVPSAFVDFDAELSSISNQSISLSNPSSHSVTYSIELSGSPNFTTRQNNVTVEGGETGEVEVSFFARSFGSDSATIKFVPIQSSESIFAAPVVINLSAKVHVSKPKQALTFNGVLYKQSLLNVPIRNESDSKAAFNIKYRSYYDDSDIESLESFIISCHSNNSVEPETEQTFNEIAQNHLPFLMSVDTIELERNYSSPLSVTFNPIRLGKHILRLLFSSHTAGEFVYEITAEAELPDEFFGPPLAAKAECGTSQTFKYSVDSINRSLCSAIAFSRVNKPGERKDISSELKKLVSLSQQTNTIFNATTSSPFFTPNNPVTNSVSVSFKPSKPGHYPCKIILTSDFDTRVMKLTGTAIAEARNVDLEFVVASGRTIVQDIPIYNPSQSLWTYRITTNGDSGFDVPQRLNVKPQSTTPLTISFCSQRVGKSYAEIQLVNQQKEFVVNYRVTAIVEDPLAVDRIILKCQARKSAKHKLDVPKGFVNNGKVKITSDVPILRFPSEVRFTNGQPDSIIEIEAFALRSGVSAGTLTLTDPTTGIFIWYIIEVDILRPDPEETITVTCSERENVDLRIPVSNPKTYPVSFSVTYSDSDLFGPPSVSIPALSNTIFTAKFTPLVSSRRASFISFFNDDEGEFNYLIDASISESQPQIVAPLSTSIGNCATVMLRIDNLTKKTASFRCESDNPSFQVTPQINLSPNTGKSVEVRFFPSHVGERETATIIAKSKSAGTFTFSLSGVGKPPQSKSPQIVESGTGRVSTSAVVFSHPFCFPCTFDISLSSPEFRLLSRRKTFSSSRLGEQTPIPFSFSPTELGQYSATLIITGGGITWRFPILGVCSDSASFDAAELKGRADSIIERDFRLPLAGDDSLDESPEQYILSITAPSGFEWISRYITLIPKSINESTPSLTITTIFKPRRPVECVCGIQVENSSHRTWQFPLRIHIDPTLKSKRIIIESTLNHPELMTISIDYVFNEPTEYYAYFVKGSSPELSLSSQNGLIITNDEGISELPSAIQFLPRTYGKLMRGTLIIDTEEAEFVFEVFGKMPDYIPPLITGPKIDSVMPKTQRIIRKKNFIKDNIGKIKIMQPRTSRRINKL